jgi:peptidyl-prolyl cis-trans isomerase A (cyclophilin A)
VSVLLAATASWATDARSATADDLAGLDDGWYARVRTSVGEIVFRLLPEQAPQSVAHFTALAEGRLEWIDPFTGLPSTDPYYDGVIVHKVRAGQRFEAGDRTGTGRGAAPFHVPEEGKSPITFDRPGRVGMTRASLGRISGAQFFMTTAPQPFLNRRHPCFGVIVRGADVVEAISSVPAGSAGKPRDPIVIETIRILAVGEPAPLPEPVRYEPTPRKFGPSEEIRRYQEELDRRR